MTDKDIIKTLECCGNQMYSCTDKQCRAKTLGNALDLIIRQQSEIERLERRNTFLEIEYKNQSYLFWERVEGAKSEAIKEFAERLKENITDCHTVSDGEYVGYDWTDITHCIDKLLKEIVGE